MLEDLIKKGADYVGKSAALKGVSAHEAWKEYVEELVEAVKDDVFTGQVSAVDVINAPSIDIGCQGPADDSGQGFVCACAGSFGAFSCFGHRMLCLVRSTIDRRLLAREPAGLFAKVCSCLAALLECTLIGPV